MVDLFGKREDFDEMGKTTREIIISARKFSCPEACRNPTEPTNSINFTSDMLKKFNGDCIFWGPYIAVPAGVYIIRIIGRLYGRVILDFVYQSGNAQIKEVV